MIKVRCHPWQLILLALLPVIGSGCTGGTDPGQGYTQTGVPGGTLHEGVVGRLHTFDPLGTQTSPADAALTALLFSSLVTIDRDGRPAPDLAERWEVTPDGHFYTLYLRPNARWHDGRLVSSTDISQTVALRRTQLSLADVTEAELWRRLRLDLLSDRVVRFALAEPNGLFLYQLTFPILPAHLWSGVVSPSDLPIGSGPYRWEGWTATGARLQANRDYYGPLPYLQQIELLFYPDREALAAGLQAGDLDAAGGLPADATAPAGFVAHRVPRPEADLLSFNLHSPAVSDAAVRRALALGINRQGLIVHLTGAGNRAELVPALRFLTAPLDPGGPDTFSPTGDQEEARRQLIIHRPAATPLRLLVASTGRGPALAEALAEQWRALGVAVTVEVVSPAGLSPRLLAGDFDAVIHLATDALSDPINWWYSGRAIPDGSNVGRFASPVVDRLLLAAPRRVDPLDRAKLYQELITTLAEEMPGVPLLQPVYTYWIRSQIHGVTLNYWRQESDHLRQVGQWFIYTAITPLPEKRRTR